MQQTATIIIRKRRFSVHIERDRIIERIKADKGRISGSVVPANFPDMSY